MSISAYSTILIDSTISYRDKKHDWILSGLGIHQPAHLPSSLKTNCIHIRNLPYEIFAYPKYHHSQGSFQEMSLYEPEKRKNNYSIKISYFVMNFQMSHPQSQTLPHFTFIELQTLILILNCHYSVCKV